MTHASEQSKKLCRSASRVYRRPAATEAYSNTVFDVDLVSGHFQALVQKRVHPLHRRRAKRVCQIISERIRVLRMNDARKSAQLHDDVQNHQNGHVRPLHFVNWPQLKAES